MAGTSTRDECEWLEYHGGPALTTTVRSECRREGTHVRLDVQMKTRVRYICGGAVLFMLSRARGAATDPFLTSPIQLSLLLQRLEFGTRGFTGTGLCLNKEYVHEHAPLSSPLLYAAMGAVRSKF
ncbi:hypothetical protein VNO77_36744 [Canavalia gladiata]|uniref:Uncharacterized protein n=1 Tax=Canavalia gladiata TaxID=3824 RepID=A0AAN9K7I4_CANGL